MRYLDYARFFLDERCFQVLFLSTSTFLGFFGGLIFDIFFPCENSNIETEETACSACGLFIQEMRRQVMKLRVEGSVS